MQILQGLKSAVRHLAFSPTEDHLAVAYEDGSIRVWEPRTRTCRKILTMGHPANFLFWSPDGDRIYSGWTGSMNYLWTQNPPEVYWTNFKGKCTSFIIPQGRLLDCCLARDGKTLYGTLFDPRVYNGMRNLDSILIWNTETCTHTDTWSVVAPNRLAVSYDGKWLVTTHTNPYFQNQPFHGIEIRDVSNGEVISRMASGLALGDVEFSPLGNRIVAKMDEVNFTLREFPSGLPISTQRVPSQIESMRYSPDGKFVGTVGRSGVVRFWDGQTGEPALSFDWPTSALHSLAFDPNGFRAAAGGDDGKIVIWDLE